MKLLSKKEIDALKSVDRKKEVDEGVKLARRIDALRETASAEEASLMRFRNETVKQITQEISVLADDREKLEIGISMAKEELRINRIPLDKEWNDLKEEKLKTLQFKADVDNRDVLLDRREKEYVAKARELEIEKERVLDERQQSKKNLSDTEKLRSEAQLALYESRDRANQIIENATLRQKELALREINISAQERDIKNKLINIARKEQDIINQNIFLKDQRLDLNQGFEELKRKNAHTTNF